MSKGKNFGKWACIIAAMSVPTIGFTAAAVTLFLHNQVWAGAVFTAFAILTTPNVRVHPPKGMDDPEG